MEDKCEVEDCYKSPIKTINDTIEWTEEIKQPWELNGEFTWTRFADFPSSLYVAKKLFKFNKCSKIFTACTNCHTLYNTAEIGDTEFKCKHVEFPNHTLRTKREPCGTVLTEKIPINKGYKRLL
ncbi:14094_t:CDS:2 [Rhizophagus irregularis]|nr:14094_t:CDS:2 [Rhizophagus irregularis]